MAKTATISAKVAPDIAAALRRQASAGDTTVSAIISDMVTRVEPVQVVKAASGVSVPKEYTNELADIAAVVGGSSLAGILIYRGTKAVLDDALENNKIDYTPVQIEFISAAIGVCAAILTGIGIHKAVSK